MCVIFDGNCSSNKKMFVFKLTKLCIIVLIQEYRLNPIE